MPEIGKPVDGVVTLENFGITAQPLRWLDILEKDYLTTDYKGIPVNVPHPARFAIHKLIISQRRRSRKGISPKVEKDITHALRVVRMLSELKEADKLTDVVKTMSAKQKKLIRQPLSYSQIEEISGLTIYEVEKIFQCKIKI